MDKYISRKAIIEELEEEIAVGDEFDEKDVLINKGLKIALKDIKRQPVADVQPISQWISVEDRLPHVEQLYSNMTCICCTKNGSVLPLRYVYTIVRKKEVYRWELMNGSLWGDDVAYWQPLPEPPKATKG